MQGLVSKHSRLIFLSFFFILLLSCISFLNLSLIFPTDDGDDIEDNQSYIKNDLEPQIEQAEATARLEHGPSSGRLEVQEVGIVTDGK